MAEKQSSGFEDGFLDIVEDQLKQCRQRLKDLDEDITRLQGNREDEAKRVAQLEDLLRGNRPPAVDEDAESTLNVARRPRGPIADADAVVALIAEFGGPMHYREIHKTMVDRGYQIGGRGNPDTLLSRYFDDRRLVRVERGTYDLAVQTTTKSNGKEPTDEAVHLQHMSFDPRPPRFEIPLPPAKISRGMGLREMAAEVLRQAGKPLHYTKITKQILRSGSWQPVTKTPEASINSAMVIDIRDNGDKSVFVRKRRGTYGLREWSEDEA